MKNKFKAVEKLSKAEQKSIFGGQNDEVPEAFCINGLSGPWDCEPPVPYWIQETYQCCDRLPE